MKRFAIALLVALASSQSHAAGQVIGTKITRVDFHDDGKVVFYLLTSTPHTTPPTCASVTGRFVLEANKTDNQTKAQLAGLLAAWTLQKTVNIHGAGHCLLGHASEVVQSIVADP